MPSSASGKGRWAIRFRALLTGKAHFNIILALPRADSNKYSTLKSGLLIYRDFSEENVEDGSVAASRGEGGEMKHLPAQFIEGI